MKILKFGGTSIGTPQRMKNIVNIINNNERKIVVLSAIAGTTDNLVEITKSFSKNDRKKINQLIKNMKKEYYRFIDKLYKTEEYKIKAYDFINERFFLLNELITHKKSILIEKKILSEGEILSTKLFNFLLEEKNIDSVLLPATNIIRINNNGEPDLYFIKENIKRYLSLYKNNKLFITQGFICKNTNGEIENLKRGGSDYTASLIGEAANAEEVQIWTDVDGFFNNDPRYVQNINVLEQLLFDEAAELAYFGAKILHPSSILPCQRNNIPVRLKNTFNPGKKGTIIKNCSDTKRIKAVAAKDEIVAIKIKSDRMLMAYGFLKKVFEVFEKYYTPIDMITTSEVAISLTIDNVTNLDSIIYDLKKIGQVEITPNQSIICIVGDFHSNKKGCCVKILDCLHNIPIRMISYGGSNYNISVLIESSLKKQALQSLNTIISN